MVKFIYVAGAFAYHVTSACDFRLLLHMCDIMCNNNGCVNMAHVCMHAAHAALPVPCLM